MDLTQVKAVVKVWEKAFKAKNKREPTKEDIKKDTSGIAEHYALYRKLAKAAAGANGSQPPSSSASTSTSTSGAVASSSQRTPRIVPNAEYPTTPTPPARRSYIQRPAETSALSTRTAEAGPSRPPVPTAESGRNLKRTASKAELEPSSPTTSTSLNTFLTPRKPKFKPDASPAYTGPVLDPNPLNPFLASPSRPRISPFGPKASSSTPYTMEPSNGSTTSPFIHASSPRKLKEVLEANSLRKVRARMESSGAGSPSKSTAMTPRTRARKRLRGEVVDDTPGKPAQDVRRKRGQREEVEMPKVGKEAMMQEDDSDGDEDEQMQDIARDILGTEMGMVQEEEEDEDDGMGPSPLKPMNGGRVFTSFSDIPEPSAPPVRGGSLSLKERLSAVGGNAPILAKEKGKGKAKAGSGSKEDGRQMKMNTFFQRSERVPKKPIATGSAATNRRASGTGPIASSSSSLPKSSQTKTTQSNGKPLAPPSPAGEPISGTPPDLSPTPIPETWDSPPPTESNSDPIERLPTPPPDPELEAAALVSTTPSRNQPPQQRKVKRITQSSDEDEAGSSLRMGEREIVIVPTRREVDPRYKRAGSLDSLGSVHADDQDLNGDEIEEDDQEDLGEEDEDSPPLSPSLPPHLLSLLSLRSPSKPKSSRQKSELVVKALFDPEAARRLKALQRGQDVRVGGVDVEDLGAEGEEDELERYEHGDAEGGGAGGEVYGDDDWEEEDEGWKRPGEDMDEGW